ncbi:MAG TPA: IPT/TIG domain-containing protein [Bryobacteraceae bacterium]|nr:IPT/TIG domain-containing protein [Bryobacteraceae bacterium]
MRLCLLLAVPALLGAQLIPSGTAIPKGPNPPVVFLNGYQLSCPSGGFSGTFGNADKVLQEAQIASVFFDNCTVASSLPGRPTIEALGSAFGSFLGSLQYTDGSAVTQVDVVAHSMGGLIVRSYLAGKADATPASFSPPANTGIRKVIFLATPHFGTALAAELGSDAQTQEMALGSQFLFDLNTWYEGLDDLRGVDALSVAGTGGTGIESGTISLGGGLDDGVVTIDSASLAFLHAGRTRLVPTCHASLSLLTTFGLCSGSAQPIANIQDDSNVVGQIILSFLTGTSQWQSLGQALEDNALAETLGGINIQVEDPAGTPVQVSGGTITPPTGPVAALGKSSTSQVLYAEVFPASGPRPIEVQTSGSPIDTTQTLPAGTEIPVILKPGPVVRGVVPAAGPIFPYNVAPGSFVAIYGTNLAGSTLVAVAPNYPVALGDVQVTVNDTPAAIQYISSGQLNVIWPDVPSGLTKLKIVTASGSFTTNVIVQDVVPSVFTLGGDTAAALNGLTGTVVSAAAPLHAGVDYVSLYLTGLGLTTPENGLDYAQIQPTVTIGGQPCNVTYAGLVTGFPALDQINCLVPAGLSGPAVPVIVTSNGRASNTVTLNIQ